MRLNKYYKKKFWYVLRYHSNKIHTHCRHPCFFLIYLAGIWKMCCVRFPLQIEAVLKEKHHFKWNFISLFKPLFNHLFFYFYLLYTFRKISAVREDDDSTNDENNQQKDERRHMMNSTRLKPTPRTPRYDCHLFSYLFSFSIFGSIHIVSNLVCIVSSNWWLELLKHNQHHHVLFT